MDQTIMATNHGCAVKCQSWWPCSSFSRDRCHYLDLGHALVTLPGRPQKGRFPSCLVLAPWPTYIEACFNDISRYWNVSRLCTKCILWPLCICWNKSNETRCLLTFMFSKAEPLDVKFYHSTLLFKLFVMFMMFTTYCFPLQNVMKYVSFFLFFYIWHQWKVHTMVSTLSYQSYGHFSCTSIHVPFICKCSES